VSNLTSSEGQLAAPAMSPVVLIGGGVLVLGLLYVLMKD